MRAGDKADATTVRESLLLPYRVRTVRIGIAASVLVIAALVGLRFLTTGDEYRSLWFQLLIVAGAGGAAGAMSAPWPKILRARHGMLALHGWTMLNLGLITLAVAVTGGARSELFVLYPLVVIFFTATSSTRAQLLLLALTLGSYSTVLALDGWRIDPGILLLRLVAIGVSGFLTSSLARELTDEALSHFVARDESDLRARGLAEMAAEKEFLSLHDTLTGVPNRRFLLQELRTAVSTGGPLALLMIDLDAFKKVNDGMGHGAGDELLEKIAQRLGQTARPHDLVARYGGDEFAVLLRGVGSAEAALSCGNRVLKALEEPFVLDDLEIDVEASVGIALYPSQAGDTESLLRLADLAMYQAKQSAAGCELYAPVQRSQAAHLPSRLLPRSRRKRDAA